MSGTEISIHDRTMYVGHEMYNLASIARISKFKRSTGLADSPVMVLWRRKWRFVLIGLGLYGVAAARSAASHPTQGKPLDVVLDIDRNAGAINGILIGLAVVFLLRVGWLLSRRRTDYVLRVESSGIVHGLLASKDVATIDEIIALIAQSMSRPPEVAITRHYNNVTIIEQHGANSIGQQHNRGS